MKRVVGLGLCVWDHLYVVEDGDLSAARTRYRERREGLGGMTANAVCQAARLGCDTHLLATVGDDEAGRRVLRALRRHGVRTRRVRRRADEDTAISLVLVDARSGERRFVVTDRRAVEAAAPPLDLSGVDHGAVLLIDGHYPEQARRAAERARAAGAPVVGDFTRPRPAFDALLSLCDYPILPLEFAQAWAGGAEAALERLARGGAHPAVTLGRRGVLAWLRGRPVRIPAPRVRAVDTTGAGDVFHGAFAAMLAREWPLRPALRFAAWAAARSCTAYGATTRLADEAEWAAWAARNGPSPRSRGRSA